MSACIAAGWPACAGHDNDCVGNGPRLFGECWTGHSPAGTETRATRPRPHIARGCGGGFRRSRACGGARSGGCRDLPSISSTARPTTKSARGAICVAFAGSRAFPRYCIDADNISTEVELFGRRYSAPFGVAPMGSAGLMWPGAEIFLAREAQRRRVPYILATPANASIERIAEDRARRVLVSALPFSPRRPRDHVRSRQARGRSGRACARADHRQRGQIQAAAGHPQRRQGAVQDRPQDVLSDRDLAALGDGAVARPACCAPRTSCRTRRVAPRATRPRRRCRCARAAATPGTSWRGCATAGSARSSSRACCIRRMPERLVSLGVDGLIVSNHGGRHFDGAPASVDMLPAIVAAVGKRATVMIDSGIRSGLDILRVLALGASAAFIGRPFLYGLGALGEAGARFVMDMFATNSARRSSMSESGPSRGVARSRSAIRARGAWPRPWVCQVCFQGQLHAVPRN